MSALIRPNRNEVSRQFPVLGYTVRTGLSPSWFEVALATEPELFNPEAKGRRNHTNFYSSRAAGPLPAERGEAVYLVPPPVLARFAGQPQLYYALAVYRQADFRNPEVVRLPIGAMPAVHISKSFTGGMRSLTGVPNRSGGLTGNDYIKESQAALEWGGDSALPGEMKTIPAPVNGAKTNGANGNGTKTVATPPPSATVQAGWDIAYDDGYDRRLWSKLQEVDEDAAYGIEGPIPDNGAHSQGQSYSRSLTASEYSMASRFEPAAATNYRTSTSPRTINRIVIHITDGGPNINGPISWFKNPAAKVSAHYIVGQDGEIVQMVHHNDVAWHAGSANKDSIGIEHVANTRGLVPTEAQYCDSAALVRWLCEQYSIPMDRDHILGHAEADPKTSHTACPNAVWNWDYFMGMVTSASCYPMSENAAQSLGRQRGFSRPAPSPQSYSKTAYASGLGFASVLGEAVERMRAEFIANVAAGSPRKCIVITNAGLRQFYGSALQNSDGTEKALGTSIQDTMGLLQNYGLAQSETVFEFNNAEGKLTKGVSRPESLRASVESWLLNEAEQNQQSAWYIFGLSVMDGYHSVVLAMAFSGLGNPDTRIYWADQIYSGWDDVTGSLDSRITSLTQRWWDPLPAERKARTRVTVWPLLPGLNGTPASQAFNRSYSRMNGADYRVLEAEDTEGIEGYEEEPDLTALALTATECSDGFCPVNPASTAGTAHFSLGEFRCRDGTDVPEKFRGNVQEVMENLEVLRTELGLPISVVSGYRSCAYNSKLEGAASKSRHLCGQAADIQVSDTSPATVHATIERLISQGHMKQGGLGIYNTFVHYDVRGKKARWDNRRT